MRVGMLRVWRMPVIWVEDLEPQPDAVAAPVQVIRCRVATATGPRAIESGGKGEVRRIGAPRERG